MNIVPPKGGVPRVVHSSGIFFSIELHVLINNIKKLNKKVFFIIQYRDFVLCQYLL